MGSPKIAPARLVHRVEAWPGRCRGGSQQVAAYDCKAAGRRASDASDALVPKDEPLAVPPGPTGTADLREVA
jgi:hypothetical protein